MDNEFGIETYDMNDLSSNGADALSLSFSANHVPDLDILTHNEDELREKVSQSQLVLDSMENGGQEEEDDDDNNDDGQGPGQGGPTSVSETSVMVDDKDCSARPSPQGGSSLESMDNDNNNNNTDAEQQQQQDVPNNLRSAIASRNCRRKMKTTEQKQKSKSKPKQRKTTEMQPKSANVNRSRNGGDEQEKNAASAGQHTSNKR